MVLVSDPVGVRADIKCKGWQNPKAAMIEHHNMSQILDILRRKEKQGSGVWSNRVVDNNWRNLGHRIVGLVSHCCVPSLQCFD